QEHRERERVRVHRPLEALERGVQVLADDRDRGRHDQVVERDHDERDRRDHERPERLGSELVDHSHLLLVTSDCLLTFMAEKSHFSSISAAMELAAHGSSPPSTPIEAMTLISIPAAKNRIARSGSAPFDSTRSTSRPNPRRTTAAISGSSQAAYACIC